MRIEIEIINSRNKQQLIDDIVYTIDHHAAQGDWRMDVYNEDGSHRWYSNLPLTEVQREE